MVWFFFFIVVVILMLVGHIIDQKFGDINDRIHNIEERLGMNSKDTLI